MAVPQFLCLAYPCNVDGGVDPVAFVKLILQRQNPTLKNGVCQILEAGPNATNEELIKKAEDHLQDRWGFTVQEDQTNMNQDHVSACSFSEQLTPHLHNEVISEFRNEHLTSVRTFLMYYDQQYHKGIRLLYLISHAISDQAAAILQQFPADDRTGKSEVWPWGLCDSSNNHGINKPPSRVTAEAQKGDLVVFSSGLLTPEWVIGVLQEAESKAENQFPNTIVIVVDACYSGTWVERMRAKLENAPLKYTRILLQTSCGPDEKTCGKSFTPKFVNLNLGTNFEVDPAAPTQTPQFFDSHNPNNPDALPQDIPIGTSGRNFRFMMNAPIGQGGGNAQPRNRAFCTFVPY